MSICENRVIPGRVSVRRQKMGTGPGFGCSTTTNDYRSPALSDTPTLDAGSASATPGRAVLWRRPTTRCAVSRAQLRIADRSFIGMSGPVTARGGEPPAIGRRHDHAMTWPAENSALKRSPRLRRDLPCDLRCPRRLRVLGAVTDIRWVLISGRLLTAAGVVLLIVLTFQNSPAAEQRA